MATGDVSENISIRELAETPPPSYYDGEESFVVLGRSPTSFTFNENASMILQDALKSLNDEQEQLSVVQKDEEEEKKEDVTNADTAENTAETNLTSLAKLSLEEIQAKVDTMLQENLELKETIQQNNMAMKKQWETILKWQEDVQKVHDSHKAKFEETKQYIEKLQLENVKLKEDLEKSQQREKALEEKKRKSSLVDKSSFENVQQFQLDAAQMKIDDLETTLKKNIAEHDVLQKKFESAQAMTQKSIAEMELAKAAWGKERRELKEDILKLEAALDEEKNKMVQKMATQTVLQTSSSDIETMRAAWGYERRELKEDILKLEAALDEEKVKTAQLQSYLDKERQNAVELQNSLSQRPRLGSPSQDEQLENLKQHLMNAQMHITDLELTRCKLQDIINDKDLELKNLSETLAEKEDVHAALRAQLDLYKADYEAEASAKNSLVAEKNQIAEDLQNLQRRNQQLIEELDRPRRDDFVHVPRGAQAASSDARYTCPKCSFKFTSYDALENHVYRCIELDALP